MKIEYPAGMWSSRMTRLITAIITTDQIDHAHILAHLVLEIPFLLPTRTIAALELTRSIHALHGLVSVLKQPHEHYKLERQCR